MEAFELKNVSKWYQKDFWDPRSCAVSDVSFQVKRGRVTGFVGPNGAGKTTTIKMIMGLVFPDAGEISIYGKKAGPAVSRNGIAYLSEQPYFYGHLTVEEALRFASDLLGLSRSVCGSEIVRVLSAVDLRDKNSSKVKSLSKGMQQRLNMAQALLGRPHTLILDEPMSGMDPPGRRRFRTLFSQLAQDGVTIFFSTHVLDDIEAVCDDVIVLSKGTVSYTGSVSELLKRGFQGVDIIVSGLKDTLLPGFIASGCQVSKKGENTHLLFVPPVVSSAEIQRMLKDEDILLLSLTERRMSLEELLYSHSDKECMP